MKDQQSSKFAQWTGTVILKTFSIYKETTNATKILKISLELLHNADFNKIKTFEKFFILRGLGPNFHIWTVFLESGFSVII